MQSIGVLGIKDMSLQQHEEELSRNSAMSKMPRNIEISCLMKEVFCYST